MPAIFANVVALELRRVVDEVERCLLGAVPAVLPVRATGVERAETKTPEARLLARCDLQLDGLHRILELGRPKMSDDDPPLRVPSPKALRQLRLLVLEWEEQVLLWAVRRGRIFRPFERQHA